MNRHWLTPRLRSWGERPALIWRDQSRSFKQLCDESDARLRALEQHGVGPGGHAGHLRRLLAEAVRVASRPLC